MPIDNHIGALKMRMPMDAALGTMGQLQAMQQAMQMNPLQVQAAQLANEQARVQNQYLPENLAASNNYKNAIAASVDTRLSNPLLYNGMPETRTQAAIDLANQQNQAKNPDTEIKTGKYQNILDTKQQKNTGQAEKNTAQAAHMNQLVESADWRYMPLAQKEYVLAVGAGAGIPPDELVGRMNKGDKITDIVKEKGYSGLGDPNLVPIYAPTPTNITQQNVRKQAEVSQEVFSNYIGDHLAPYVQKVGGISWDLLKDQVTKGKLTDDEIVGALAANIVMPELAGEKFRTAYLPGGITATQDMIKTMMGNAPVRPEWIKPDQFTRAQALATSVVSDGFEAGQVMANPYSKTTREHELKAQTRGQQVVKETEAYKSKMGGEPLKVPEFNTREEFQAWYNGLSPAQKAQAKSGAGK